MADKKRHRFRNAMLLLLLLLLAGAACLFFWPGEKIKIGPDTTVLTGPLNPDGTVNYVEAINQQCSAGVTADNNAAIPILQAMGPAFISSDVLRPRVLRILKIESLPPAGDYFVSLDDYVKAHPAAQTQPATSAPIGPRQSKETPQDIARKASQDAQKRPWTEKDFPLIADWLAANSKPLAVVTAGAQRPKYYLPMLSEKDPPQMLEVALPSLSGFMNLSKAVTARAMLRIGQGNLDAAWQDIMTTYRLARLIGRPPILINAMVAVLIDGLASRAAAAMIGSKELSADQARAMLAELEKLPPTCNLVESIDKGERYFALDAVAMLSRGQTPDLGQGQSGRSFPAASRINWNKVLRRANWWYDGMTAALRQPTGENSGDFRKEWNDRFVHSNSYSKSSFQKVTGFIFTPTEAVTDMVLAILVPSIGVAQVTVKNVEQQRELVKIALALAAWKADHGSYPDKLDVLAPKYLKAIPNDLFTEKPLLYRLQGPGYILYSVGANLKDEGGRKHDYSKGGSHSGDELDDIVVEVPLPPPATQPAGG